LFKNFFKPMVRTAAVKSETIIAAGRECTDHYVRAAPLFAGEGSDLQHREKTNDKGANNADDVGRLLSFFSSPSRDHAKRRQFLFLAALSGDPKRKFLILAS
jgi:hypothetical protein